MRRESPNGIKNPENDPERVAVAPPTGSRILKTIQNG